MNSNPHACTARILVTEPSSALRVLAFSGDHLSVRIKRMGLGSRNSSPFHTNDKKVKFRWRVDDRCMTERKYKERGRKVGVGKRELEIKARRGGASVSEGVQCRC